MAWCKKLYRKCDLPSRQKTKLQSKKSTNHFYFNYCSENQQEKSSKPETSCCNDENTYTFTIETVLESPTQSRGASMGKSINENGKYLDSKFPCSTSIKSTNSHLIMTKSHVHMYKNNDLLNKQTPELHSKESNNHFLLKNQYEKTGKHRGKYNDELESEIHTKYLFSSTPIKYDNEKEKLTKNWDQ